MPLDEPVFLLTLDLCCLSRIYSTPEVFKVDADEWSGRPPGTVTVDVSDIQPGHDRMSESVGG